MKSPSRYRGRPRRLLWKAWGEVRANRGAAGVDGVTIDDVVRSGVGDFLDELAVKLRAGTYRPRPPAHARIWA